MFNEDVFTNAKGYLPKHRRVAEILNQTKDKANPTEAVLCYLEESEVCNIDVTGLEGLTSLIKELIQQEMKNFVIV